MDCGKMNKRITIQQIKTIKNEFGNDIIPQNDIGVEIIEWFDYCDTYSYVNGLSGGEYYAASAVQAENTVVFTMRYNKKLDIVTPQKFRISFNKTFYDIKHIDNVQYANEIVKIRAVAKIG